MSALFPLAGEEAMTFERLFDRLRAGSRVVVVRVGEGHDLGWIARRLFRGDPAWTVREWPSETVPSTTKAAVVHLAASAASTPMDEVIAPAVRAGETRRVIVHHAVSALAFRDDAVRWAVEPWTVLIPAWRVLYPDVGIVARVLLDEMGHCGREVSAELGEAIQNHPWLGGHVELAGRLARGVALSQGSAMTAEHLGLSHGAAGGTPAAGAPVSLSEAKPIFEALYILGALARENGNRTTAARRLGVDVRTVFRVIERLRESAIAVERWPEVLEQVTHGSRSTSLVSSG